MRKRRGSACSTRRRRSSPPAVSPAGGSTASRRRAQSNKAQIYHYFGSKDGLFDAVFDRIVNATVTDTPIDPTNLPEYAGRLFDRYQKHPEVQRLATWYRLERADGADPIEAIVASNADKVKAIDRGAARRTAHHRFEPAVLLASS